MFFILSYVLIELIYSGIDYKLDSDFILALIWPFILPHLFSLFILESFRFVTRAFAAFAWPTYVVLLYLIIFKLCPERFLTIIFFLVPLLILLWEQLEFWWLPFELVSLLRSLIVDFTTFVTEGFNTLARNESEFFLAPAELFRAYYTFETVVAVVFLTAADALFLTAFTYESLFFIYTCIWESFFLSCIKVT